MATGKCWELAANATDRVARRQQFTAQSAVVLMAPDWVITAVNYLSTRPRIVGSLVRYVAARLHSNSTNMWNTTALIEITRLQVVLRMQYNIISNIISH